MHPEGNTPNNQSQCHTDQPTPGRAESHEAGVSSAGVSATTQSLIDLLRSRDAAGLAKHGTTLDRTDLSVAEWTQHAVEELLDAAGYLLARRRTEDQASAPVGVELDYTPGELDRTAPPRIWLQIDTSASNDERDDKWPETDGVSWWWESIGGLEIQYVRADLAQQPAAVDVAENIHIRPHANEYRRIRELAPRSEYVQLTGSLVEGMIAALEEQQPAAVDGADKRLLDAVGHGYWGLVPFSMPTPGGDDADVGWRVIEYHRAAPHERVVAEHFHDDPRAALAAALAAQQQGGQA